MQRTPSFRPKRKCAKIQAEDRHKLAHYEKFWRRVLVDVLKWSILDFEHFLAIRRNWLRESGSLQFFHDLPYKYVCRELLSEKLRQRFQGVEALKIAVQMMKALPGGSYEVVWTDEFNPCAARERYSRLLRQLELDTEMK